MVSYKQLQETISKNYGDDKLEFYANDQYLGILADSNQVFILITILETLIFIKNYKI